jgi:hypothetical protein
MAFGYCMKMFEVKYSEIEIEMGGSESEVEAKWKNLFQFRFELWFCLPGLKEFF